MKRTVCLALLVVLVAALFMPLVDLPPVAKAATANFGHENEWTVGYEDANYIFYDYAQCPQTGTVSSMFVYCDDYGGAAVTTKVAIYDESKNLVGSSEAWEYAGGAMSPQWHEFTFSPALSVTADAYYYFAKWSNAVLQVGSNTATGIDCGSKVYDGSFPATMLQNGGPWTNDLSIYAVVTYSGTDWNWMGGNYTGYYNVTAASGSAEDIQAAVDNVEANGTYPSAGCGNVFVDAGNYTFNINFTKTDISNTYAGVEVSGGVNIFGAGGATVGADNTTILFCGLTNWNYSKLTGQKMFCLTGTNGKPIRIAGLYFQGTVNYSSGADDDRYLSGIGLFGVKDFRIDHCTFVDFCNAAIGVTNNYVHDADGNCGVIDHVIIDQQYKNTFRSSTGTMPLWGYGITVAGDYPNWDSYLSFYGNYWHDTVFIEDSSLARCRHMVAGSQEGMGFYVMRYCNLTDMVPAGYGSYQDIHSGTIGCEVYNCTIINTVYDSRTGDSSLGFVGIGLYSRGGASLYYNNTIKYFNGTGTAVGIRLVNLDANPTYRVQGTYVWNNSFTDCTTNFEAVNDSLPIISDVHYFLRAPSFALDGFTYTPYGYPHPLVSGIEYEDPNTYVLNLSVTAPTNTTYTGNTVAYSVSNTGNETSVTYQINAYYSNGTAVGANNTASSGSFTLSTGSYTFACSAIGAHSATDYETVAFSVTYSASGYTLPVVSITGLWTYLMEGDFIGFFWAMMLGTFTYSSLVMAVMYMLFFVPLYIRTHSLMLICILWILIGGFIAAAMPEVAGFALLFMALGVGGLLYRLFRPSTG